MEKVTIELPTLVEAKYLGVKRKSILEYTMNGKILSKEEADAVLQQWIAYIKKLVPESEVNLDGYAEYLETPHERAVAGRNSLIKHFAIAGQDAPKDILDEANKRIDSTAESTEEIGYKVQLCGLQWCVEDWIVSEIDLRFYGSKPIATVWTYNDKGDLISEDYSWEEGVKKYLENGKEWLRRHAPEMEIPLPPCGDDNFTKPLDIFPNGFSFYCNALASISSDFDYTVVYEDHYHYTVSRDFGWVYPYKQDGQSYRRWIYGGGFYQSKGFLSG